MAGEGAGQLRERAASCLQPFRGYIQARFADDPHLDATVLQRELVAAGFALLPDAGPRAATARVAASVPGSGQHRRARTVTVEIEHPPGEEIQWDWLELHDTPWGQPAFVLVGASSHSGRFRRVF